jgi:hypothetical protein
MSEVVGAEVAPRVAPGKQPSAPTGGTVNLERDLGEGFGERKGASAASAASTFRPGPLGMRRISNSNRQAAMVETDIAVFAANVSQLRREKKLSQTDVANRSPSTRLRSRGSSGVYAIPTSRRSCGLLVRSTSSRGRLLDGI